MAYRVKPSSYITTFITDILNSPTVLRKNQIDVLKIAISVPGIIFWVLGIPALAFYLLWKNRKNIQQTRLMK